MILNRQKSVAIPEKSLAEFVAQILRELKLEGVEVSVAFVSDAEIARWNKKYRGKRGPTDVLSFPALNRRSLAHFKRKAAESKSATRVRDAGPGATKPPVAQVGFLGDIAIAPATAARYAVKNKRSLPDELRVLMLHGILHLLGYDHESDLGEMNRIEDDLRRRLNIA